MLFHPKTDFFPEGNLIHTPENREALGSEASLEKAMREERILEAPVILCDESLNLHLDLGFAVGIIPRSEVVLTDENTPVKDIAIITRVGKPVCFLVREIKHENGIPKVILSRRAAQKKCREEFLDHLVPGDILPAKVTHLEPFGAFVDIGCGVVSLLSVDCISVSRISHPEDRLKIGEAISVAVKTTDRSNGRFRIYVTMKELLGTWMENASLFSVGQTVRGIVRSVETYGVFIELTPNLAGLAEIREPYSFSTPPAPGQSAAVFIKSMMPEKMKIKLVLIDLGETVKFPSKLRYIYPKGNRQHIDRWVYSPVESLKVVESVFS